ncbi:hypothetical protein AB0K60_29760 [Thermopolyspora sp. NPDC052614]|uniref:hypothetical protein n=1 Tax=Thermopolyspora sp. NPDC052614 TaxID=3155682 RepID=UPI00342E34AE
MMRRVVLAATVVLAAVPAVSTSVALPVAAQAADTGTDPAYALKRQLRSGHGLRTSETVRVTYGDRPGSGIRFDGKVRLSPSGVAAVDFTWRDIPKPGTGGDAASATTNRPHRTIRVGASVYCDSGQYSVPVPDGKTWVRLNHRAGLCWTMARTGGLQPINVYDQAMIKAVLRRSTKTPVPGGFRYQGAMTYRTLAKIFKGAYVDPLTNTRLTAKSTGKIAWRLWTGRDGLPTRLITTDTLGGSRSAVVLRADTRYSRWGRPPAIAAPPAHMVIEENDLLSGSVPDPEPILSAAN